MLLMRCFRYVVGVRSMALCGLLAALAAGGLTLAALSLDSFNGQGVTATTNHTVVFHDDFESGKLEAWQMPYPEDWSILAEGGNHFLHMNRNREPGVPRRPLQFALIRSVKVGSFDFQARLRRSGKSMIVVFNYVDTLHFYYAHLSRDRGTEDAVHNGIFIVNGEPRKRIAGTEAPPALPDTGWHRVRIARNARSGSIQVFMDDESKPLFSVVNSAFQCGQIGIGSFDETGDFDDVLVKSNDACELRPMVQPEKTASPK